MTDDSANHPPAPVPGPLSPRPLEGRVALVTGGSRGIGAGISRKLAAWGATVAINYVDRGGPAKELAAELTAAGAKVTLHRADLSEAEAAEELIAEVAEAHGDLHILVQNAAATKFSLLEDATLGQWQFVQDTNARATWLLAKHAVPLMKGRPGARFITITNSTTTRIVPRAGLLGAAKAALENLTRFLSYELAPHGIVANCVRPGLVQTGVFNVRPDFNHGVRHELSVTPWTEGQMTTPENSADVVAMLCLDEAAWIVGQTITVDGGYALWGNLNSPLRVGE
ncbi:MULTISPECIES: SDR family oxidoreductase [unclassified Streptomyces]|uniref:SDR family NAD(P)-dependent oxidoreductase n=1 Tax=Streptomycetaceae TaxID=2062 RepID=UPI002E7A6CFE|nr:MULTISPECIES: SDR family oxidoreductase [unclassified Streptomyces]MED7954390.1 SDR family oxidoreductase [Streptomyces sp. BE303]MEE1826863.1 SDR family oxidoreductase [Streptomyces sp. BE20]